MEDADHAEETRGVRPQITQIAGVGGIPLALQGVLMYFIGVGGQGGRVCEAVQDPAR